jgi:ketosteroid isomerase-like protein
MARDPLPPVAIALSFIDAINHGDIDRLGSLMTEDHRLRVLDEPDLAGRDVNVEAWHGYASSFPDYVIYPQQVTESGDRVAVLGYTTGSHLGLPDEEERNLTLIWIAETANGAIARWQLVDDTPDAREQYGFVRATSGPR